MNYGIHCWSHWRPPCHNLKVSQQCSSVYITTEQTECWRVINKTTVYKSTDVLVRLYNSVVRPHWKVGIPSLNKNETCHFIFDYNSCFLIDFTVQSSYASAVIGIVILSVHPSHVYWDETIEQTAGILIPRERVIHSSFLIQQRLVGMSHSIWNLHLKWPTPIWKTPTSTNICL